MFSVTQIHETVENINMLKTQREFFLGFAKDPQEFISNFLISQTRDLKVNIGIFLTWPSEGFSTLIFFSWILDSQSSNLSCFHGAPFFPPLTPWWLDSYMTYFILVNVLPSLLTTLPHPQTMTDVVGNPEEERRSEYFWEPWTQEGVNRYFYSLVSVWDGEIKYNFFSNWDPKKFLK